MGLQAHVNASGFPLQIAIGNAVNSQTDTHGFSVLYSEHAWKSPDSNSSGFADLVISSSGEVMNFVIECKRVLDSQWSFLIEGEELKNRRHAKAFVFRQNGVNTRRFEWLDLTLDPGSPESGFCVMPGAEGNKRQLIERIAAELVEATEGIANEEKALSLRDRDTTRIYFPVLITTAKLFACLYTQGDISLATGTIANAKFEEVPFVRFRKQVSPTYQVPEVYALFGRRELSRAKENTIFVVNSERFNEFLCEFNLDSDGTNRRYLNG